VKIHHEIGEIIFGRLYMKKHGKKIICGMLVLTLLLSMTGCTTYNNFKAAFFSEEQVAQEKTIKIGIYESTSGQNSTLGKEEVRGIELAHELYPTVLGLPVELIYADNQSNMYVAETAIQELLSQKPMVVLGSCGETVTLVASDYIKAANVPAITMSATNPLITANNEFYFSATYTETRQGDALAEFAYEACGNDLVATVKMENDDAATEIIKRFTNKIKKLTGNSKCVVANYTLKNEMTDYTEVLEKIRESGAKSVFLAVPPATAEAVLQQAVNLEVNQIQWLGGRSWHDKDFVTFVTGHPTLEVAYSSDFGNEVTTELSAEFLEAYQERYGVDILPPESAAVAFDAYLLALRAIERAQEVVMETTLEDLEERYETEAALKASAEELLAAQESGIPSGRHIRMALSAVKNFEGASGNITFNGKNEATKTITVHHYLAGIEIQHYHVD